MNILKNSYVLGVFMIIMELTINNLLFAAKLTNISGIILASIAGCIYSAYHKELMPRNERFKTLGTYLFIAGSTGIFIALMGPGASSPLFAIGLSLALLLVYGIFMYFMLGVGSSGYMASYEKKQISDNVLPQDRSQNILTPIPNSVAFQNRHPKFAILLSLIVCVGLFIGVTAIAADSLFENNERLLCVALAGIMALIIVGALWRVLGKKLWIAFLSLVILSFIAFGTWFTISHASPAPGADKIMLTAEQVALRCLAKGANLRAELSGSNRGMPQVESAICNQEFNWKNPPSGWRYTKIVDPDVSDGTFAFGVHSREGAYIFCGEKWCVERDAMGSTTILYTVPAPVSAIVTFPQNKAARAGEKVEIAQITLSNSSTKAIDLTALWLKKSGTASDAAIQMIDVDEGGSHYGMNYLYNLHSPYTSKDGMVYINQPDMFSLQPGQTRIYSIKIELSTKAHAEAGKTIGLDFTGFSYDPQVSGMPASGITYQIQ